uniref:C-type lectin domain-containing protein n=1 Tax=Amazona collaria TaxID=241587 RepID=A0A8B9EZ14_9PSIT
MLLFHTSFLPVVTHCLARLTKGADYSFVLTLRLIYITAQFGVSGGPWNLSLEKEKDHPTASRPADSKTFSIICEDAHTQGLELTTENGMDPMRYGENRKENHTGCPKHWEKNGGKCYFFSQRQDEANWNDSRKECTDMKADLVIIDNKDELNFLSKRSRNSYYLLGLTYSHSERKWKWINNMELSSDMFCIGGDFTDYFCAVIGHRKVETAPCSGSLSTQNMCEKDADISESQKEY